jgi:hypothetical protein
VSVNFQPGAEESAPPTAPPSVPPSAPISTQPSPARRPTASLGGARAASGPTGTVPPSPEPGQEQPTDDEEEAAPAGEGDVLDIWKHDEEEQAAVGEGVAPSQVRRRCLRCRCRCRCLCNPGAMPLLQHWLWLSEPSLERLPRAGVLSYGAEEVFGQAAPPPMCWPFRGRGVTMMGRESTSICMQRS